MASLGPQSKINRWFGSMVRIFATFFEWICNLENELILDAQLSLDTFAIMSNFCDLSITLLSQNCNLHVFEIKISLVTLKSIQVMFHFKFKFQVVHSNKILGVQQGLS